MLGHLRITIKVYIHQSNHQKTQTIGVNKKHKNYENVLIQLTQNLFALSHTVHH